MRVLSKKNSTKPCGLTTGLSVFKDTTQRNKNDDRLRDRQILLKSVIDSSAHVSFGFDKKVATIFSSEGAI